MSAKKLLSNKINFG